MHSIYMGRPSQILVGYRVYYEKLKLSFTYRENINNSLYVLTQDDNAEIVLYIDTNIFETAYLIASSNTFAGNTTGIRRAAYSFATPTNIFFLERMYQ